MPNPDVMTTTEAAALLGVDRSVVIRRVAAGALEPLHKLHGLRGAYLFDRSTIEAIASERKPA